MNYDDLAFFNHQLAAMLREGIPLEGSLKQLCASMREGELKKELAALEADLEKGVPLAKAVEGRKLPEFYTLMVQMGSRSGDLPGILTLLADYYQAAHLAWTRLKGLSVYPVIILGMSFALSAWIAYLFSFLSDRASLGGLNALDFGMNWAPKNPSMAMAMLWLPPVTLLLALSTMFAVTCVPGIRRELGWRLPGFAEANVSRFSAAMAMLLNAGCSLPQALDLMEQLAKGTSAAKDIARWRTRCAEGVAKFSELAKNSVVFPPMFVWLVSGAGDNLALGFQRAADAYRARANYRTEILLYAFLPTSVLVLGVMIIIQILPLLRSLFGFYNMFSNF